MVHVSDVRKSSDTSLSAASGTGAEKRSPEGAEVVIDDDAQEATDSRRERVTDRADLAERMQEASWFQDHPDALFVAGLLAVVPSVWSKIRRAVRARR